MLMFLLSPSLSFVFSMKSSRLIISVSICVAVLNGDCPVVSVGDCPAVSVGGAVDGPVGGLESVPDAVPDVGCETDVGFSNLFCMIPGCGTLGVTAPMHVGGNVVDVLGFGVDLF